MGTEGTGQVTQRTSPLMIAVQLLGAAAGLGALMAFVGGAILWIRFDELRLPADHAVNLLPNQLLVVVGAHSIATPVAVGAFAALVFVLINSLEGQRERKRLRVIVLALLTVPFAIIAFLRVQPYDLFPEWIVTLLALALAGFVLAVAIRAPQPSGLPWVVFAVFALCGAVVAIMRTTGAPTMEPVALLLKGTPSGVSGFYIGQTTDRVYIAPLPGTGDPGDPFADAEVDRVMEIDRDTVRQMALREPAGTRADEAGREEAQSLLEDLRVLVAGAPAAAPELVTTADPIAAFAPLVHLHSREDLWPMSAERFLAHSWLGFAHDDGCRDWVPGGRHLAAPRDDAAAKGKFDPARLAGPNPYVHYNATARCRDSTSRPFKASDHTRPFDRKERPRGLGEREGFYLDLDDRYRGGTRAVKHESGHDVLGRIPVYYQKESERVDDQPALRITYWFFYGLSRPPGKEVATRQLVHEGDWERISVLLVLGERTGDYSPTSVRYHAHDGSRDIPWNAVKRVGTGGSDPSTHPVVFSARGSHASYWKSGRYENVFRLRGRRRFAVYDDAIACPRCPQWRTWESLRSVRQPWYGFGGAWGAVGSNMGFTGPLGPSRYKSGGLSPSPADTVSQAPSPLATPPR